MAAGRDFSEDITERDIDLIDDIETLRKVAKFLLRKLRESKSRFAIRDAPPVQRPVPPPADGGGNELEQLERELAAISVDEEAFAYKEDIDAINELLDRYRETGSDEALSSAKSRILDLKVKVSRRKKIGAYLVTIRKWDEMGYNVDPLVDMINRGDVVSLEASLDTYKMAIQKLEKIRESISNLQIPEPLLHYIDDIHAVIKEPTRVLEAEKLLNELLEEKVKMDMMYREFVPENRSMLLEYFREGDNGEVFSFLTKLANGNIPPSVVYLHGPERCGKTHLLVGLYNQLDENGRRPVYLTYESLGRRDTDSQKAMSISRFILVDGLNGTEERPSATLVDMIDRAVDSDITMVIAGRLSPEDIADALPRLGERLSTGLTFEVKPLPEESFREIANEIFHHYGDTVPEEVFENIISITYPDPSRLKKKITEILAAKAITGEISLEKAMKILKD